MLTSNAAANTLGINLVKTTAKIRLEHDKHLSIHQSSITRGRYSTSKIAGKVICSQSAVSKTLSRLRETGSLDDRKHSRRPRITTPRDDRSLIRLCLHNRTFPRYSGHVLAIWFRSGLCGSHT